MGLPTKAFPIDPTGRVLFTEAADKEIATAKITVGTTATTLAGSTEGFKRRKLFVRNTVGRPEVVVYIGDANVTTSAGFPLYRHDELELDVDSDAVVKAIRASGDDDGEVRIMEVE